MKDTWEDYFIEGSDLLKNNLNINDKDILEKEEKKLL